MAVPFSQRCAAYHATSSWYLPARPTHKSLLPTGRTQRFLCDLMYKSGVNLSSQSERIALNNQNYWICLKEMSFCSNAKKAFSCSFVSLRQKRSPPSQFSPLRPREKLYYTYKDWNGSCSTLNSCPFLFSCQEINRNIL